MARFVFFVMILFLISCGGDQAAIDRARAAEIEMSAAARIEAAADRREHLQEMQKIGALALTALAAGTAAGLIIAATMARKDGLLGPAQADSVVLLVTRQKDGKSFKVSLLENESRVKYLPESRGYGSRPSLSPGESQQAYLRPIKSGGEKVVVIDRRDMGVVRD